MVPDTYLSTLLSIDSLAPHPDEATIADEKLRASKRRDTVALAPDEALPSFQMRNNNDVEAALHTSSNRFHRRLSRAAVLAFWALAALSIFSFFVNLRLESFSSIMTAVPGDVRAALGRPSCPALSADQKPRVHFLVPATESSEDVCLTLASLLIHEYEPVILNWKGEGHHFAKIEATHKYIVDHIGMGKVHPPVPAGCPQDRSQDDIVIALDAYDMMAQRTLPSVLRDFYASGEKVIFGAEKPCWPELDLDGDICGKVPESSLPADTYGDLTDDDFRHGGLTAQNVIWPRPRFLNSGFVIGYAQDLLTIYEDALVLADRFRKEMPEMIFDQGLLHPLHAAGNYSIMLDYRSRFTQTMGWSTDDVSVQPVSDGTNSMAARDALNELSPIVTKHGLVSPWVVWNHVTKNVPAFVHFNGLKPLRSTWLPMIWWGGRSGARVVDAVNNRLRSKGFVRLPGGEEMSWEAICGPHWPPKGSRF